MIFVIQTIQKQTKELETKRNHYRVQKNQVRMTQNPNYTKLFLKNSFHLITY